MRNILTVAAVLGTLCGTAHAATSITSPLYLPKKGEFVTEAKIGYTSKDIDIYQGDSVSFDKSINLIGDARVGITDKLAFNVGMQYDFARENGDEDASAKFTNYYAGLTYRLLDDANKLDFTLNFGTNNNIYSLGNAVPTVDFSVKYGRKIAQFYDVAFSLGGIYSHEDVTYNSVADVTNVDSAFDFYAKLENEFIVNNQLTFGLDLSYKMIGERDFDGATGTDSSNEFKVAVDANYAITPNNYVGVYFDYTMNDEWNGENGGDVDGFSGGLKLTSKF